MDIIAFALQMEKDGENLYRRLAEQTDHKGVKAIFTLLADEEVKHYNHINALSQENPEYKQTNILGRVKNVFARIKEVNDVFDPKSAQVDLYRQAQDIEKKSEDFYRENAPQTPKPAGKKLFLQLAEEEKRHYYILDNLIEFVSRPQTWLETSEFYHLDEY